MLFRATQLNRLNEFLPDSVDNVQLIIDLNSLADPCGCCALQLHHGINPERNAPPNGDLNSADGNLAEQ